MIMQLLLGGIYEGKAVVRMFWSLEASAGGMSSSITHQSLRRFPYSSPILLYPSTSFRWLSRISPHVYGVPTYDALFKYILSHNNVRPSFFKAFIPGVSITSSKRLDDHMNPIEELQLLRTFLHADKTQEIVKRVSSKASSVHITSGKGKKMIVDNEATAFLHEMVGRFDEIKVAFPDIRYNGTMDFVCQLSTGEYAMVEMQVMPQNYWDRRALAYVSLFYGNQLRRGERFEHIRKVIGVNILGGGKDNLEHWTDTPDQFVRYYKFQEQLYKPERFIDGIELIQYSIMNTPASVTPKEQQDWITFFKEGHYMSESDVHKCITTPAVLEAFKLARIKALPAQVLAAYEGEDKEYDRYSQHTESLVQKGEVRGEAKGEVKTLIGLIDDGTLTLKAIMASNRYSDEVKREVRKCVKAKK